MSNKIVKRSVANILLLSGICLFAGCGVTKENEAQMQDALVTAIQSEENVETDAVSESIELDAAVETIEEQAADYTIVTAGSFTTSEVEQYAAEIRDYILDSDWWALSEQLAYPITINGNVFLDSADFVTINISKVLSQDFVDAIEAESCENMFCNWQGISMGDAGQVWIGCSVEDDGNTHLKVIGLNGMLEVADEDLMLHRFYEKVYDGDLSYEKMNEILDGRGGCYQASCYYEDITYYWEVICGTTDVSNFTNPLFFTDMKYYTVEDFADVTPVAIHLAKNEIYARHGYIFKNEDLNNYFLGCTWYEPLYTAEEFDISVFNDFEQKNLQLLAELDKENFHDMLRSDNQEGETDISPRIGVEAGWEFLKTVYFSEIAMEEKGYDENGAFQVVINRTTMPFTEDDVDRPCEEIVFYDGEEDGCYLFGHYYVFYEENGDVFATRTRGWYQVDCYTGGIKE